MGLTELIREGAMDLLGVGEEVDALREVQMAAVAMARRFEDLDFSNLLKENTSAYFDPDRDAQRDQTQRAFKYFFNDPIVKRSVLLRTYYTFGKGVPRANYKDNRDADPSDEQYGNAYIERFEKDPDNERALTGYIALTQRDIELQLQSNLWFNLFRSDEQAPGAKAGDAGDVDPDVVRGVIEGEDGKRRPATMKIVSLPDSEFVDVINHPETGAPVFYKRQFRPSIYNASLNGGQGGYEPGELTTLYYRHWRNEAPRTYSTPKGEVKDWPGYPPEQQIAGGVMYHVAINRVGSMKFGLTELQSILKWSKGLNEYMTARMAMVQAIAQIAMRVKTRGGARSVQQTASVLNDLTKLAGAIEGTTSLSRSPTDAGRTKVSVENQGAELQPMITDTGAAQAQGDIQTMRGHIAAGSGVPEHHLGGPGSAGLATATSMDAPLLRMIEFNQELWETVRRDLTGYMIEGVGLDPGRIEVQMPPILERDVGTLAATLTNVVATLDPQVSNKELMRFVLAEVLDAMGKVNTQEILDRIFPPESKTPFEMSQELAAVNQAMALGALGGGGAPEPGTPQGRAAVNQGVVAAAWEQQDNGGRRRGPTGPGGPDGMGADSRARAQDRRAVQVEGDFDFDALLPAELREAADRALAAFDP